MNALFFVALIEFSGPDNQIIWLSPEHVISVREPRSKAHFPPGTHCIVMTSDGKFIALTEMCGRVRQKLDGSQ